MHVVHQHGSGRKSRTHDGVDATCIHPVVHCVLKRSSDPYWTVIEPFMFIARCGVQMYSYLPAATLAKETV